VRPASRRTSGPIRISATRRGVNDRGAERQPATRWVTLRSHRWTAAEIFSWRYGPKIRDRNYAWSANGASSVTKREEAALPREMSNPQLIAAWNMVTDCDRLTMFAQAVIAEMERREIDF